MRMLLTAAMALVARIPNHEHRMTRRAWSCQTFLIFCWLSTSVLVQGALLNSPQMQWIYGLPMSSSNKTTSLLQGNGVQVTSDGQYALITTAEGDLHVLNLRDTTRSTVYEPTLTSSSTTLSGANVQCTGGAVPVMTLDGERDFAVYAVAETLTVNGAVVEAESRVLAVYLDDGSLKWEVWIPGMVVGTPVSGKGGRFFYVVHNLLNAGGSAPDAGTATISPNSSPVGKVSVIVDDPQQGPIVTATYGDDVNQSPFAPPAGLTWNGTDGNLTDVVLFGSSWQNGYATNGGLFLLTFSPYHASLQGRGAEAYILSSISSYARSMVTRPALSAKDLSTILVQQSSVVASLPAASFFDGTTTDVIPNWQVQATNNQQDPYAPMKTAATLTQDGSVIVFPTLNKQIVALKSNGQTFWTTPSKSPVKAEIVVQETDRTEAVVYVMQAKNGAIGQYDLVSGSQLWSIDCSSLPGLEACDADVEANFALSPSGNTLYYGDTKGRIVALDVGNYATPAPTVKPSIPPTAVPSLRPSKQQTSFPSTSPSGKATVMPSGIQVAPSVHLQTSAPSLRRISSTGPSRAPNVSGGGSLPAPVPVAAPVGNTGSSVSGNQNTASQTTNSNPSSSSSKLPVLLGVICGVLLLAVAASLYVVRRRGKKRSDEPPKNIFTDSNASSLEGGAGGISPPESSRSTPVKLRRTSTKKGVGNPLTPSTLDSIAESSLEDGTLPDEEPPADAFKDDDSEVGAYGFEMSFSDASLSEVTISNHDDDNNSNLAASIFGLVTQPLIQGHSEVSPVDDELLLPGKPIDPPKEKEQRQESKPVSTDPDEGIELRSIDGDGSVEVRSIDGSTVEPGRISSEVKRPVPVVLKSPRESDLLSVDSSLYYDDSTILSQSTRDDRPDDESSMFLSEKLQSVLSMSFLSEKLHSSLSTSSSTKGKVVQSKVTAKPSTQERATSETPVPTVPSLPPPEARTVSSVTSPQISAPPGRPRESPPLQRSSAAPTPVPISGATVVSPSPANSTSTVSASNVTQTRLDSSARTASFLNEGLSNHSNNRRVAYAGASVRPRAGLFTRRQDPLTYIDTPHNQFLSTNNELHSNQIEFSSNQHDGTMERRTALGPNDQSQESSYELYLNGSPDSSNLNSSSNGVPLDDSPAKVKTSPFRRNRRTAAKSEPTTNDSQQDAWSSFLNELARAEEAFFNPKLSRSKPKPHSSRSSRPTSAPKQYESTHNSRSSPPAVLYNAEEDDGYSTDND